MSGSTFAFTVTAIDKAFGPLKRIAEQMRPLINAAQGVNRASADGASAQARMTQAMAAHAQGLRGHFQRAGDAFTALRGSVVSFLPMLGALGAGGSLVGLVTLTKSVAEATLAADALQKQVGISGKQLGVFTLAARMAGVPADNIGTALTKMQKAMADAAVGQKEPLAALFKHLNISLRDAKGAVIDVATALPRLMDAFEATTDQGMRARMAAALFEEEGLKLIPMLIQGSGALKAYAEAAAKLNYIPLDSEKAALKEFEQSWIQLEMAASSFKKEIGAKLAPVLLPVIKLATDWVVVNREWIATGIAAKVKQLVKAFEEFNLKDAVITLQEWGTAIAAVMEPLGGLKTAIGAFTLMLGSPLLIAVSSAITIMGALGKAMLAVGMLMWANPILVSVGAVLAIGLLLWKNWDWVSRKFKGIWEGIKESARLQRLIDDLKVLQHVPGFLNRAWQLAKGQFQRLWSWFKSSAAAWVRPVVDGLKPFFNAAADMMKYWEPVKTFFVDLWKGIVEKFDEAWKKMRPIIEAILKAAESLGIGSDAPVPGTPGPVPHNPNERSPMTPLLPDGRRRPRFRPYDPSSAAPSAAPTQPGRVDVNVTLSNAPPGTRVATQTGGGRALGNVTTDVGYSNPLGGGY